MEAFLYRQRLRKLWSKRFLDVTILEIVEPGEEIQTLEEVVKQQKQQKEKTRIINYDPFGDILKVSKTGPWFPNKLQNLQGYEMVISFVQRPPEIVINRDQNQASGLTYEKVTLLSELMNFKIKVPNITSAGIFSCFRNGTTHQMRALVDGDIHVVGIEFGRYSPCANKLYEFSRGISTARIVLFVPIIEEESSVELTNHRLSLMIVTVIPVVVSLTFQLLHFEERVWRMEYILQIIIGFVVPNEPKNKLERAIFLVVLFSNLFLSSLIFTSLTSVYVTFERKEKFKSIQDVLDSEISIQSESLYYRLCYNASDADAKKLFDKSERTSETILGCIKTLVSYKNITCIGKKDEVLYLLNSLNKNNVRPEVKVIEEEICSTLSNTALEPGSPFVKHIDKLVQRMYDAGIVDKWWDEYLHEDPSEIGKLNSISSDVSEKIIKRVLLFVSFGFAISTIAFIGELLIYFSKNPIRNRW